MQYTQNTGYSIHLNQKEYTDAIKLAPARTLTKLAQMKLDGADVKMLRALNGEIQWLAATTRPDLAARVSISAGAANFAEATDLRYASKLVTTARADADLPITFNPTPIDNTCCISFSDPS